MLIIHRQNDIRTRVSAVSVAVALVFGMTASAQDRLAPIPAEKMTDAQRAAAAADFAGARGGEVFGPFVPLLRSPELMTRARAMGDYLRFKSALPPRLSEFVILITAREWTQQHEWHVHYDIAIKAGLNPEIAAAVADGPRPSRMAGDEEILYDFCVELQRNRGVSDAAYTVNQNRIDADYIDERRLTDGEVAPIRKG